MARFGFESNIEQVERIREIRPAGTTAPSPSRSAVLARLRAAQAQITPEERARREAQEKAEGEEFRRAFFQEMEELAELRRSQGHA